MKSINLSSNYRKYRLNVRSLKRTSLINLKVDVSFDHGVLLGWHSATQVPTWHCEYWYELGCCEGRVTVLRQNICVSDTRQQRASDQRPYGRLHQARATQFLCSLLSQYTQGWPSILLCRYTWEPTCQLMSPMREGQNNSWSWDVLRQSELDYRHSSKSSLPERLPTELPN